MCLGGTLAEKLKCVEVLTCPGPRGEPGWRFHVLSGHPLMLTHSPVTLLRCEQAASSYLEIKGVSLSFSQHRPASGHRVSASFSLGGNAEAH